MSQDEFARDEHYARLADLERAYQAVTRELEVEANQERRSQLVRRREEILDDLGY